MMDDSTAEQVKHNLIYSFPSFFGVDTFHQSDTINNGALYARKKSFKTKFLKKQRIREVNTVLARVARSKKRTN